MTQSVHWLNSHGDEREQAIDHAVALLTSEYRQKYPSLIPPELHRLSATLSATVAYAKQLEGGARLLPVPGGFEILVDSSLDYRRARTAIAHELVHTLFYSREGAIPTRLMRPSPAEEHFCFDVGRRILAPLWMVELAGIQGLKGGTQRFFTLLKAFKLSRPVAARLLLQDYRLASGVAAAWSQSGGIWRMKRGNCFASPELSRRDRVDLHNRARQWLVRRDDQQDLDVSGTFDESGVSAFVLVTRTV